MIALASKVADVAAIAHTRAPWHGEWLSWSRIAQDDNALGTPAWKMPCAWQQCSGMVLWVVKMKRIPISEVAWVTSGHLLLEVGRSDMDAHSREAHITRRP